MKKYVIFIISLIILISLFSDVISKSINQKSTYNNKYYQIYERSSMQVIPIYPSIKNNSNRNFSSRELNNSNNSYNYVIITDENLVNSIQSSTFLEWKEYLGFNIKIIETSDSLIKDQSGDDLPAKIRNFLRSYYQDWGIFYVLMVGDHETIPMRYCYPDPNNHNFDIYSWSNGGEVPTDYYYADLSYSDSESWDSDGDGFYGEFNEDHPDFKSEVYVGRIPTSQPEKIIYSLNKIVAYEQDTSEWKNNALHAGSILFFKYQDHQYNIDHDVDGATCLYAIENDFMDGWTVSHLSEQEGLSPSKYRWAPLTEPYFTEDWRTGKYAVVNWAGHGSAVGVGRTIWDWDDGDEIPEFDRNEIIGKPQINIWSDLEDDYPSIVFAVSCLVGFPESVGSGNLGIDLLVDESLGAAVAVCSATRPAAVTVNFTQTHSGAEALCYEFNHYMINGPEGAEPIGVALYESKYYVHYNFGWDTWYYEYKNMYNYNLYGDPSMRREGITSPSSYIEIIKPENGFYFNNNKIFPFFTSVLIGDVLIKTNTSENTEYVEFYVDDVFMFTDADYPFEWNWDDPNFFKHKVKVVAYDMMEEQVYDELVIWKFF